MLNPPQFVEQVLQSEHRVSPGHPRAGKAHDLASGLALRGLVAVNRTIGAGRLFDAVGAFFQPPFGVGHQFGTIGAKDSMFLLPVVMIAKNMRHAHQGLVFLFQSAAEPAHHLMIKVLAIHLFDPGQQRPACFFLLISAFSCSGRSNASIADRKSE